MRVHILAYRPAHARGVRELIVPIQRQEFGIDIAYEDQPDLVDIDGFYRPGNGEFWVAADDGRVVGTIALKDIGDGQGALRKMFVASELRGTGTADRLLTTLLKHAQASGFREVLLGTTAQFPAAHRFYEKNGFNLIDESDLPDTFPRMAVDTRFYRMAL